MDRFTNSRNALGGEQEAAGGTGEHATVPTGSGASEGRFQLGDSSSFMSGSSGVSAGSSRTSAGNAPTGGVTEDQGERASSTMLATGSWASSSGSTARLPPNVHQASDGSWYEFVTEVECYTDTVRVDRRVLDRFSLNSHPPRHRGTCPDCQYDGDEGAECRCPCHQPREEVIPFFPSFTGMTWSEPRSTVLPIPGRRTPLFGVTMRPGIRSGPVRSSFSSQSASTPATSEDPVPGPSNAPANEASSDSGQNTSPGASEKRRQGVRDSALYPPWY